MYRQQLFFITLVATLYTVTMSNVDTSSHQTYLTLKHKPTRLTGYSSHRTHQTPSTATLPASSQNQNSKLWVKLEDEMNEVFCPQSNFKLKITKEGIAGLKNNTDKNLQSIQSWFPVCGLFGMYEIPSGQMWIWITSSQNIYNASTNGLTWWQIQKVGELRISYIHQRNITHDQQLEENRQVHLLRSALKNHEWYYCVGSIVPDITRNLQLSIGSLEYRKSMWWEDGQNSSFPDSRFFWNEAALEKLLQRRHETEIQFLLNHTIPLTSAFVGVQSNLTVSNTTYDQVLITRRSRFRAGTRFTKRGVDHTGAVANYAETEQIILLPDAICSHVQTRGSIPLHWSSPTDIKTYRPRVQIGTNPVVQARSCRQHLLEQISRYALLPTNSTRYRPSIVFLNLIDKKKDQGRLGKAFDAVLSAVLDVYKDKTNDNENLLRSNLIEHVWYDFHAQVKHGRWGKIGEILNQLKPRLHEHGYFRARPIFNDRKLFLIERLQSGVIRTNCMDCLDRTNVVQSMLGRYVLFSELAELNLISLPLKAAFRKDFLSLPWMDGEKAHRLLWADNADTISRLYAGTPALKGDFTRSGQRTQRGILQDGINSLQRYYLNNFIDADRQEGIDLLTGTLPFRWMVAAEKRQSADGRLSASTGNVNPALVNESHVALSAKKYNKSSLKWHLKGSDDFNISFPSGLHLLWLPGDLQDLFRGSVVSSMHAFSSGSVLQDIDRRAASTLPWWLVNYSDAMGYKTAAGRPVTIFPLYLIGACFATILTPCTMTAFFLVLMCFAFIEYPRKIV